MLSIAPIFSANAIEYQSDNWKFKLDADGMIGFLEPKSKQTIFINDWDVKGQMFFSFNENQRIGTVYSVDAECLDNKEYIHDAFILLEDRTLGRAELGLTNSITRKMGLGLPDVGDLRINEKSLLYKKLDIKRTVIAEPIATTGHEALRLNLASKNTTFGQYGISLSGFDDTYDYAIDFAFKYRHSVGKIKTAYSFAMSFMDNLNLYEENSFTPSTSSDWRGQTALGFNLQYNSWIFGTSTRLIYDKEPTTKPTDGLVLGSGVSYDLLQSSVSLTYLYSRTNIWNHTDYNSVTTNKFGKDNINTLIASFRYKYSGHTSLFMSTGFTEKTPFFSVGLKTGF